MTKNIIYILLIIPLVLPFTSYGQINDTLSSLCSLIEVENYDADSNYPYYIRNCKYGFKIEDDSLIVHLYLRDSLYEKGKNNYTYMRYKASMKEIKPLKVKSVVQDFGSFKHRKTFFELASLRSYLLIDQTYLEHNFTTKSDLIELPIIIPSDTTTFKKIANLINEYGKIENNYIPPNCKVEHFKTRNSQYPEISAIESGGLEKPIRLNQSLLLEKEIHTILKDYLIKENIQRFYADIVIDKNDQLIHVDSYQNQMYNFYSSQKELADKNEVMIEKGFLKITDAQLLEITNLLKAQTWETGKCNDQKVTSYFDFSVENAEYKGAGQ